MSVPAATTALGGRKPSREEQAAANRLRKILAAQGDDTILRMLDNGKTAEVALTPALSGLLMDLLGHVGKGDAVALVPVSQMLTTQQAADLLNVSRPFLISLLDQGEIEYMLVGRHRRIEAEALFAYKEIRDAKRRSALDTLAELDGEML